MTQFLSLFDVNNTWFTTLGYQMSGVEFWGTIFNLWCVWLVAKNKILNWPVGIIGSVLFAVLFYQIHLYSDFLEQWYYVVTGFWGWWMWTKGSAKAVGDNEGVEKINKKEIGIWAMVIVIGTLMLTYGMKNLNVWFPMVFPVGASYAFLDALTTVMSFVAQWLLTKRKLENWYLWICVDVIGVGLYFAKGVVFVSLLYFVFLILATKGLLTWKKIYKSRKKNAPRTDRREVLPTA